MDQSNQIQKEVEHRKGLEEHKIHYNNNCIRFGSWGVDVWIRVEIPGCPRWEVLLSCSKYNQSNFTDSSVELLMRLIRGISSSFLRSAHEKFNVFNLALFSKGWFAARLQSSISTIQWNSRGEPCIPKNSYKSSSTVHTRNCSGTTLSDCLREVVAYERWPPNQNPDWYLRQSNSYQ